jgi:tRNA (guanine37-N1)-methyltransferase
VKLTGDKTWVALLHHPVSDRTGKTVTTALTNLDLHDIARSCRTYGVAGFFIVHPVAAQRELASRIADHWRDEGAEKNDFRRDAISRVHVVDSLDAAIAEVKTLAGAAPKLISTSAKNDAATIGYDALGNEPTLLLFGTGWGMTEVVLARCEARLAPIAAHSDYNHLSVRSACAIILDRLLGDRQDRPPSKDIMQ